MINSYSFVPVIIALIHGHIHHSMDLLHHKDSLDHLLVHSLAFIVHDLLHFAMNLLRSSRHSLQGEGLHILRILQMWLSLQTIVYQLRIVDHQAFLLMGIYRDWRMKFIGLLYWRSLSPLIQLRRLISNPLILMMWTFLPMEYIIL